MKDKYTLDIEIRENITLVDLMEFELVIKNFLSASAINSNSLINAVGLRNDVEEEIIAITNGKPKEKIKLELGKYYLTRDRRDIFKILHIRRGCTYCCLGVSDIKRPLGDDGHKWFLLDGSVDICKDSGFDLVKEVKKEDALRFYATNPRWKI